ncbi:MAG: SpoIIE family protein phosphatase [Candidatus Riflebacteria bacterium]|nr:SpoIIE family protein phosphatase [Candidatus Riflebacteria bacterium]
MASEGKNVGVSSLFERLILLFMVLATFLTLIFAFEHFFSAHKTAWQNSINTEKLQFTENLAASTYPIIFLRSAILPIHKIINENPQLDIELVRKTHEKYNGLQLAIYKFDNAGKLISTAPKRAPNLWIMRNMFPMLTETDNKKLTAASKELDKKIEHAFGFGKSLSSISDNPETLIETVTNKKDCILSWSKRENGGLIITCDLQLSENETFKYKVKNYPLHDSLVKTGVINDTSIEKSFSKKAFEKAKKSNQNDISYGGLEWFFVTTNSGKTIYCAFDNIDYPMQSLWHNSRLLTAILLFVGSFLLIFADQNSVISLKRLIISIFLVSSLIPLAGIAFIAITNIDVFKQNHENKLRTEAEETLRNIILNFNSFLAEHSTILTNITQDPGTGAEDKKTLEMVKNVVKTFPKSSINLRNSASELFYNNSSNYTDGRETVYKSLSRRIIERYAPQRLNEAKYSGNPFTDALVRKDDMGFNTLTNFPNQLQKLQAGTASMLFYYRLIPNSNAKTAYIQIDFPTLVGIEKYLQTLKNSSLSTEAIRIQISAFLPTKFRWLISPYKNIENKIFEMSIVAAATNKTIFRELTNDSPDSQGLALCIPAPELENICLTAYFPAKKLMQSIKRMQNNILIGCLIAVILLYSIIQWLMNQLISPLGNLKTGIIALGERKFEVRINVPPGNDELTQLFSEFNFMMSESYDMQVAQNVQDGLITKDFPELAYYSMYGICKSAGDLGGDCLDCFKIDDNKILFLIGDLTGHSVGSALMMAFTRAVTFNWSQQKSLALTDLVDSIDTILRNSRTQRMFMGIICGMLYPDENKIELVVKGHIYPLKINADKSFSWVGLPSYPLGISKQTPAVSQTISFKPGDKILCLTDGFLEAQNKDMRVISFDNIEKWALETMSEDTQAWVNSLEKKFNLWCQDNHADDVSIFAIAAHPQKEEESKQNEL